MHGVNQSFIFSPEANPYMIYLNDDGPYDVNIRYYSSFGGFAFVFKEGINIDQGALTLQVSRSDAVNKVKMSTFDINMT